MDWSSVQAIGTPIAWVVTATHARGMNNVTLEHAFFYVKDLDRALAYYAKILPDWIVRWDGRKEGGYRWVHFGPAGDGQPGYLSICEDADASTKDGGHIGFAHPDVAALEAALAKKEIRPTDRAEDGRYRRIYLEDPDGHELEFVQRL
jgi:catechol 2,3-dioxygenase-like lactoylglutathione lyase family enzyme